MVEVRFACISSVPGVKCVLDGVTKYSNSIGICNFFGISQGAHSYSVESPEGWFFVSGEDVFGRDLPLSGTTVIEYAPIPGYPWPETSPWMMLMNFQQALVDVPTKLSLFTPSNVASGESFEVFGVLQRSDTNAALNGELIELWIDGLIRESMLTTTIGTPMGPQDGAYLFTRSISASGTHTIEVRFPGSSASGVWKMSSNAVLSLVNNLRALI